MAKIIFDIETVGYPLESFDETTQEHLLRYAKTEEEQRAVKDTMSLYPVTARLVTIAMLELETEKAFVYYLDPEEQLQKIREGDAEYFSVNHEKQLLELFWARIAKYDQFITFNGRSFDCPFIMLRSAINRLKASKNLMPDRYRSVAHIDLMEKLTFLGAFRRKFSLHVWCNAFGIKSPKDGGIAGNAVKSLFEQKKYLDIARYCLGDVAATRELYRYWEQYINF